MRATSKLFFTLNLFLVGIASCKNGTKKSTSNFKVVNGVPIKSEEDARRYATGAYGVQMVYKNAAGDTKQKEATGFFTDQKGTTFVTNAHVAQLKPPEGYKLESRTIVDYAGNTVQSVPSDTTPVLHPQKWTDSDNDLAAWKFEEGTPQSKLTHGTAQFEPKATYKVDQENLRIAGYGMNTNDFKSGSNPNGENPEYQIMRAGNIDPNSITNPGGDTFGYYGPKRDSDSGNYSSSAHGDSGAPIYNSAKGTILGINRGGKNEGSDSYSEAINPYSPGATSFFKEVQKQGGTVEGWNDTTSK